jgi:excisionase family DNA binding protein
LDGKRIGVVEQQAYTIEQAAEAASLARQVIYDEINAGRLRARKRGRSTRILASDLRAYLEALPVLDPKAPSRDRAIAQRALAVRYGQRVGSQGRARNKFKEIRAEWQRLALPK